MKKRYTPLLLILTVATTLQAINPDKKEDFQKTNNNSSDQDKCFDENTHIVNLGIGFGGAHYYNYARNGGSYGYNVSPAFSLSYEQPWKPKLGPGFLGVGAYVGYQHASYRYNYSYNNYYYNGVFYNGTGYYYQHNWNSFMVAARGAYHWDVLNSDKAEIYAGLLIGLRFQTYSYTTNDNNPYQSNNALNQKIVYPTYSVFAGARWYFVPKFALFGEVGFGISYVTGGVSYKF